MQARDKRNILLLIIIRLITSLIILKQPFLGFIIANFADAFDAMIMHYLGTDPTDRQYQLFDKTMDNILLFIIFISIFVNNLIPQPYLTFAVFLFGIRIIGSTLALITRNRRILLFTPNFFYYYFAIFAFLNLVQDRDTLNNPTILSIAFLWAFLVNYYQEILLHYKEAHPSVWIESQISKLNKSRILS